MVNSNRTSFLIKNTLVFTIGNFATKFITFFLIPLYTRFLSISEYGTIDLISTIATILAPVFVLNITESVMRFSLDKDAKHDEIIHIGLLIYVVSLMVGCIIFPVVSFFPAIEQYRIFIYLYMVTCSGSQLLLAFLRGKEKLVLYSIGNVIQTIVSALGSILFIGVLGMGINGYFYAYIVAALLTMFYAFIVGNVKIQYFYHKINSSLAMKMLKYSIVLIPNTFMWWIMNASDRLMVTSMVGVAANGVYAISYKLPTLVSTMTTIFNQAWSYSAIREEGASDEEEYNNLILRKLIVFVMIVGVGIIAFSKPFLKIYVSEEFFYSWHYIPFLTIGCVYLTFGSFMSTSYSVHKDSVGYMISGCCGAVLNVVLNFALIPVCGVYGAAIATCLSYIFVFIYRIFNTRKYIKYDVINKPFIIGTIILGVSSIIVYLDGYIAQISNILLLGILIFIMKGEINPLINNFVNGLKKKTKR